MDLQDKKFKISIETYEEKPIHLITYDGKEHTIIEPSNEEKFSINIRQIDFEKYSGEFIPKEKTKDEIKNETKTSTMNWPWNGVAEQLLHARIEIEQLMSLINILQAQDPQNLVTLNYVVDEKVSSDKKVLDEEKVLNELSKKKELQNAASILKESEQRLRKIVDRDQHYFDDLLQIRNKWLIKSPQQLGAKKNLIAGKLYVDYGYRSAGSTVKAEAELAQKESGKVSISFDSNQNKVFQIFSSNNSGCVRRFEVDAEDELQKQLNLMQQYQFYTELFQQLTNDTLLKGPSYVYVVENEIKIEDEPENPLTIKFEPISASVSIILSFFFLK